MATSGRSQRGQYGNYDIPNPGFVDYASEFSKLAQTNKLLFGVAGGRSGGSGNSAQGQGYQVVIGTNPDGTPIYGTVRGKNQTIQKEEIAALKAQEAHKEVASNARLNEIMQSTVGDSTLSNKTKQQNLAEARTILRDIGARWGVDAGQLINQYFGNTVRQVNEESAAIEKGNEWLNIVGTGLELGWQGLKSAASGLYNQVFGSEAEQLEAAKRNAAARQEIIESNPAELEIQKRQQEGMGWRDAREGLWGNSIVGGSTEFLTSMAPIIATSIAAAPFTGGASLAGGAAATAARFAPTILAGLQGYGAGVEGYNERVATNPQLTEEEKLAAMDSDAAQSAAGVITGLSYAYAPGRGLAVPLAKRAPEAILARGASAGVPTRAVAEAAWRAENSLLSPAYRRAAGYMAAPRTGGQLVKDVLWTGAENAAVMGAAQPFSNMAYNAGIGAPLTDNLSEGVGESMALGAVTGLPFGAINWAGRRRPTPTASNTPGATSRVSNTTPPTSTPPAPPSGPNGPSGSAGSNGTTLQTMFAGQNQSPTDYFKGMPKTDVATLDELLKRGTETPGGLFGRSNQYIERMTSTKEFTSFADSVDGVLGTNPKTTAELDAQRELVADFLASSNMPLEDLAALTVSSARSLSTDAFTNAGARPWRIPTVTKKGKPGAGRSLKTDAVRRLLHIARKEFLYGKDGKLLSNDAVRARATDFLAKRQKLASYGTLFYNNYSGLSNTRSATPVVEQAQPADNGASAPNAQSANAGASAQPADNGAPAPNVQPVQPVNNATPAPNAQTANAGTSAQPVNNVAPAPNVQPVNNITSAPNIQPANNVAPAPNAPNAQPADNGTPAPNAQSANADAFAQPADNGTPAPNAQSANADASAQPADNGTPAPNAQSANADASAQPADNGTPAPNAQSANAGASAQSADNGAPAPNAQPASTETPVETPAEPFTETQYLNALEYVINDPTMKDKLGVIKRRLAIDDETAAAIYNRLVTEGYIDIGEEVEAPMSFDAVEDAEANQATTELNPQDRASVHNFLQQIIPDESDKALIEARNWIEKRYFDERRRSDYFVDGLLKLSKSKALEDQRVRDAISFLLRRENLNALERENIEAAIYENDADTRDSLLTYLGEYLKQRESLKSAEATEAAKYASSYAHIDLNDALQYFMQQSGKSVDASKLGELTAEERAFMALFNEPSDFITDLYSVPDRSVKSVQDLLADYKARVEERAKRIRSTQKTMNLTNAPGFKISDQGNVTGPYFGANDIVSALGAVNRRLDNIAKAYLQGEWKLQPSEPVRSSSYSSLFLPDQMNVILSERIHQHRQMEVERLTRQVDSYLEHTKGTHSDNAKVRERVANAAFRLGRFYYHGTAETPINRSTAFRYFDLAWELSAETDIPAAHYLSDLYATGVQGVPPSIPMSFMFRNITRNRKPLRKHFRPEAPNRLGASNLTHDSSRYNLLIQKTPIYALPSDVEPFTWFMSGLPESVNDILNRGTASDYNAAVDLLMRADLSMQLMRSYVENSESAKADGNFVTKLYENRDKASKALYESSIAKSRRTATDNELARLSTLSEDTEYLRSTTGIADYFTLINSVEEQVVSPYSGFTLEEQTERVNQLQALYDKTREFVGTLPLKDYYIGQISEALTSIGDTGIISSDPVAATDLLKSKANELRRNVRESRLPDFVKNKIYDAIDSEVSYQASLIDRTSRPVKTYAELLGKEQTQGLQQQIHGALAKVYADMSTSEVIANASIAKDYDAAAIAYDRTANAAAKTPINPKNMDSLEIFYDHLMGAIDLYKVSLNYLRNYASLPTKLSTDPLEKAIYKFLTTMPSFETMSDAVHNKALRLISMIENDVYRGRIRFTRTDGTVSEKPQFVAKYIDKPQNKRVRADIDSVPNALVPLYQRLQNVYNAVKRAQKDGRGGTTFFVLRDELNPRMESFLQTAKKLPPTDEAWWRESGIKIFSDSDESKLLHELLPEMQMYYRTLIEANERHMVARRLEVARRTNNERAYRETALDNVQDKARQIYTELTELNKELADQELSMEDPQNSASTIAEADTIEALEQTAETIETDQEVTFCASQAS